MREFSRVSVHFQADLFIDNKRLAVEDTRDVSLNGIFLKGPKNQEIGADCEVSLYLKGVEPPIELHLKGSIQRVDATGCGVQFQEVPLESFDHLRRLVQLNCKDLPHLEKEEKGHVGLHKRG